MKKLILIIAIVFCSIFTFAQMTLDYSSANTKLFSYELDISIKSVADTTIWQAIGWNTTVQIEYDSLTLTGTGATLDILTKTNEDKAGISIEHPLLPHTIVDEGGGVFTANFTGGYVGIKITYGSATAGILKFTLLEKNNK